MSVLKTLYQWVGTAFTLLALAVLCCTPCLAFAKDFQESIFVEEADAEGSQYNAQGETNQTDAEVSDFVPEKNETVRVNTDATGAASKVKVTTHLKNSYGLATLRDATSLVNISANDGVDYQTVNGELLWDAQGYDITYTGDSAQSLPITFTVSYFLNGEEVTPEEIAGKEGDVTIRYDFFNEQAVTTQLNGKDATVYVPFTCISALMLNAEDFTDVQVTNGRVIEDGSDIIVAGYALPGLAESLGELSQGMAIPESFEVSAYTQNFTLKSSMTVVSAGFFQDVNIDELGLDLSEDLDYLSSSMDEIAQGAHALSDGIFSLADGAAALRDASYAVAEGTQELTHSLDALAYGKDGQPGLDALVDSSSNLVDNMKSVDEGLATITDETGGLPALSTQLNQTVDALQLSEADRDALIASIQSSSMSAEAKLAWLMFVARQDDVQAVAQGIDAYSAATKDVSKNYHTLVTQSESLPLGVEKAVSAAAQLYEGSEALTEAAYQLADGSAEYAQIVEDVAYGSDDLSYGIDIMNEEGISGLVGLMSDTLNDIKDRAALVTQLSADYNNFGGKLDGTAGSVKFIYQTAGIEAE